MNSDIFKSLGLQFSIFFFNLFNLFSYCTVQYNGRTAPYFRMHLGLQYDNFHDMARMQLQTLPHGYFCVNFIFLQNFDNSFPSKYFKTISHLKCNIFLPILIFSFKQYLCSRLAQCCHICWHVQYV